MAAVFELLGPLIGLLTKIFPDRDAEEQRQAAIQILELTTSFDRDKMQADINQAEASNNNLFVSGWRPACGWLGVAALAYHAILVPLILLITTAFGMHLVLPAFDASTLQTLLFGMLGIGGLRTFEKIKGKTAE